MLAFSPGTLFGERYEIVRQIGTGGMGAVYEVLHRETRRRRALKVMLPTLLVDDDMRRRFALEAVVTADIESEHIVEIFDAGIDRDTGAPFIVMELLRGEPISERLERGERYGRAETVELLGQAARALAKTHAAGIVHRDLKPENLFVTRREDGSARVKILDFGIAKMMQDGAASKPQTRSVGTPLYMAPEQLSGEAKRIGPAADAWSLAQVAYAMLVGEAYFEEDGRKSENVLALLLKVSRGVVEPASARARRAGVVLPERFDGWFARATALEPGERFASAVELVESLGKVEGETSVIPRSSLPSFGRTAADAVTGDVWEGPTGPRGTVKLGQKARLEDEPTVPDDRRASRSGAHATHAAVTGSATPAPRPRSRALVALAGLGLVGAGLLGVRALGGEGASGVSAVPPAPPSASPLVPAGVVPGPPRSSEPDVSPGAPATAAPTASASAVPRASAVVSASPAVGALPGPRPKPTATEKPASPPPTNTSAPVWTVR